MLADPTGKLARARTVYGRRYPEAAPEDHQEDRSWTCWKKQQKRYENRAIKIPLGVSGVLYQYGKCERYNTLGQTVVWVTSRGFLMKSKEYTEIGK